MTAYCVLSLSPLTVRGSMRIEDSGVMVRFCVVTRLPSLKRYHFTVTEVAATDWSTIGVVHPVDPPSVRVTFGRYVFWSAVSAAL